MTNTEQVWSHCCYRGHKKAWEVQKLWKVTLPLPAMWHSQCTVHSKWCCSYISSPKDIVGSSVEKCDSNSNVKSHPENKHSQKLLWDGELKYTFPIQPPEFCCVTGTLHSCSKGDKANLVYVHLLHLPCLKVRLHNPDWLPAGKIQMPKRSNSRSFSSRDSQSLRNYW